MSAYQNTGWTQVQTMRAERVVVSDSMEPRGSLQNRP